MTMAMLYDGTTRRGPMPLPTTAQKRLDGGGTVSNLQGADWQTRNACGYYDAIAATPSGGMVITASSWPLTPDSNNKFVEQIVTEIPQAEYDASQDAKEAARKNTPLVFDQPIEVPVVVLQSHEAALGVGVMADDDGAILSFTYHASPIPSPAEIKARKDAAKAKRGTAKTDWKNNAGKGQLQKRIEALEAAMHVLMGTQEASE